MIDSPLESFQGWVLYFSQCELPVLQRTIAELARLRENEDNITARDIWKVLLHDPLMSLKVLRYLQEHRRKSQITDVNTGANAIMMLGTTPFFRNFENQKAVEDHLAGHPEAREGLMRVASRSFHAATYAHEWAAQRHDIEANEISQAALLHDMAEMLLWCFAPKLASQIRQLQRNDPSLRSSMAQQSVLGFKLQNLQLALGEQWHLPQLLQDLMDDTVPGSPRTLNVSLAVSLARHSTESWFDAALPDDYRATAHFLRQSEDDTVRLIHRQSLLAAQSHDWYSWPPSARWLPLIRPE